VIDSAIGNSYLLLQKFNLGWFSATTGIKWYVVPVLLASNGSFVSVKLIVYGKGNLRYRCSNSTILLEIVNWLTALS
jgi:hypothetical protein